jgi:oligopeptide/dipeptide ABC transporter ATP-binding protein
MTNGGDTTLLRVESLSKQFSLRQGLFTRRGPGLTAIDDVSLKIDTGQIYGLVGESGSGKSTLGRAIIQLVRPDSGRVIFKGRDLCTLKRAELRRTRKKLQVIFQDPSAALSPRRTILQTLVEPLEQFQMCPRSERLHRCGQVLETVGLDRDVLHRLPHQLSSGQKQRIGIARALLSEPDLIIADEAVSALDVSVQAQILDLVRMLQAERGIAFMFITHDLSVIPQLANVVGVMFQGQIVESAPVESLFSRPSHPYTQELIAAIPDPDPSVAMSAVNMKAGLSRKPHSRGCVFADRCSRRLRHCSDSEPRNHGLKTEGLHQVKCHLHAEPEPVRFDQNSESIK